MGVRLDFFFLAITVDEFKHPYLRVLVFFFLSVHVLFIFSFFITISMWGFLFFFLNNNKVLKNNKNGLVGECFYFVGNILVQVKHILLPNYHLVLSLLKPREIRVF